jgi:hypothetical protein
MMRMRIRSRPSAGAVGKRKSGPRARSTNSRPSKQLPAFRLMDGVGLGPAIHRRRQRTAASILATPRCPAQPDWPAHARGPLPRTRQRTPARNGGPAPRISRRTASQRPPETGGQFGRERRLPDNRAAAVADRPARFATPDRTIQANRADRPWGEKILDRKWGYGNTFDPRSFEIGFNAWKVMQNLSAELPVIRGMSDN